MGARSLIWKQIINNVESNQLLCRQLQTKSYRYLSKSSCEKSKSLKVLDGNVDKNQLYERNKTNYDKLLDFYSQFSKVALAGGGEKAIHRHTVNQQKMLATERVKRFLDKDADYLELSLFAGLQMEYGDIPRAGAITGIGKVHGIWCMVVANDATVKGGTVYPITLQKQLRAQEIANQNHLPTVYVIESGGAFLPLQSQIFNDGGRTFYNEAVMSSQGIPQIAIVCGNCTAGGAYVPTMADEAVMINKKGYIFLGGPPLVQAATGEIISAEELGGAVLHCSVSGCTDYFAVDENEALELGRDIIATLNITIDDSLRTTPEDPLYDSLELPGIVSEDNTIDMYKVVARITDGSRFHEFKTKFGNTLLTGFAHIHGHLVGIVANNGELTAPAADKGAHFVQLCGERSIPLIFLQNTAIEDYKNITGVENGNKLRAHAKMMTVVSTSPVPKITVIVGNSIGPVSYIMGGKAVSPNFIFCWPNAVIGLAEPQVVSKEICSSKDSMSAEDQAKILEKCNKESSAFYAASRMWNDGILLPQDTRQVIRQCLSITAAFQRIHPIVPVIRM